MASRIRVKIEIDRDTKISTESHATVNFSSDNGCRIELCGVLYPSELDLVHTFVQAVREKKDKFHTTTEKY